MDIEHPTELLEKAGDRKVRARLLQWLFLLKNRIIAARSTHHISIRIRNAFRHQEKVLFKLKNDLRAARRIIHKQMIVNTSIVRDRIRYRNSLRTLSRGNRKLIKDNNRWCLVEKRLYKSGSRRIKKENRLFKNIIHFFLKHYGRLHSFIKRRYHR